MTSPGAGRARRLAIAWGAAVAAVLAATLSTRALAKDPETAVASPSLAFYARRIAPWVDATCAPCHAAGAGGLRFGAVAAGPAEAGRREAEFKAVVRFLDREAPWRSRLILKAIPEEQGGLPHGGGALLRTSDDAYDDLLDFASGATLDNLPPEPEPGADRRIRPGEAVVLDGTASYDRDDDPVSHRWELVARPPGSRAALVGDRDPKATFVADVPGTYVARLRVFDGKVWSPARPVVLEALDRAGPTAPDPVASSGLERLDPSALRLARSVYGDLLGRPPTPPEALACAGRSAPDLATTLLKTLESGRAWLEDTAVALGLVGDAEPVSPAVQAIPFRWVSGELTPAAGEGALAADPSFLRAHPPGPALARAVERLLLERPGTAAERESWATPAGLAQVLRSDAFAAAARRRFVARFLAEGSAPPEGLSSTASTAALATALVESPAYVGATERRRRPGDTAFVRAVFADLLGRRPTSVELLAAARAAAVVAGSEAGRALVIDVLLDSGEVMLPILIDVKDPDAWLADRFLRFLGRPPGPAEAKAYRAALLDPDGGPQLVVRALLTTPEYAAR